ncbi:hypothetical protein Psi02_76140 [Planotetraspora silvatica]|uniref:Uncharacterized protein n=1 Tax=Planotetraspora silvatica TaxID=234614 RepID=A0A8J3UUY3_9ACTN|nr:hypothetical protein [Planotetraspora silvatica]GII51190.1 hypothetical protein Psi02_76140 [Planotetraspora silvatica]
MRLLVAIADASPAFCRPTNVQMPLLDGDSATPASETQVDVFRSTGPAGHEVIDDAVAESRASVAPYRANKYGELSIRSIFDTVTPEEAREAGAADGRNQALAQIFIIDPTYRPTFLVQIDSYLDIQQSRLLIERGKALGLIEREARVSSATLTIRVNELHFLSGAIKSAASAPEIAGIDPVERESEVPSTMEGANQERMDRRFRRYNSEIESNVILLSTANSDWLQCWKYFKEEARIALKQANILVSCYSDGLLQTHQHAEKIAREWRPQEFSLRDEWLQDPTAELQIAIPRGVRDSADQAWDYWMDLLRA